MSVSYSVEGVINPEEKDEEKMYNIDYAVNEYCYHTTIYYQVDLKKIPKNIKFIRFCCSY
jgi:hypothetical protein